MSRRRTGRLATLALGLALALGVSPATAAPYVPNPDDHPHYGFFSVPYGPDLYWSRPSGYGGYMLNLATFDEWASQGYPTPRLVPSVRYDRAPWSPTIIAAPRIPGWPTVSETHALTWDEWSRVGYPNPTVTWTPAGTYYRAFLNSPDIYAYNAAGPHRLTFDEWRASGSPAAPAYQVHPDTIFYQWSTSAEIFMKLNGSTTKLSYPQWASYGYPSPMSSTTGFAKLTWDPTIAYLDGRPVTWDEWVAQAFPTPQQYASIPGDEYCYDATDNVVAYDGLTFTGEMDAALGEQRIGVPLAQMAVCVPA
ncbi:hypothetical protein ASD16_10890 [Cellulomonas sp. Root485]|uniref:hypothetical protein n=1 Tax=Cellulomonas sp. Root485 TaxID=1736546 RepID=UPI0006FF231F|nr:hypothetical protein [Cellulomonas sp. Root485]KQY23083.1 hypothetical protein ASD16_10890 [Cellulomonas sp. Root485]